MSAGDEGGPEQPERRIGESLRAAVERTLEATAGPAATTRERASELVDDVVRRGREAGDRLVGRGHRAGDEAPAGAGVTPNELAERLAALELRLAAIEELLRDRLPPPGADQGDERQD